MQCSGTLIRVVGGPVWQWDTGRAVRSDIAEPGDLMDFAELGSDEAITVAASDDGTFPIPNVLLRRACGFAGWLRREDATEAWSAFKVLPRPEPPDYEYIETPTVGYQQLRDDMLRRLAEMEEKIAAGGYDLEFTTDEDIDGLFRKEN